jgi:hypothetical protein
MSQAKSLTRLIAKQPDSARHHASIRAYATQKRDELIQSEPAA